MDDPRIIQSYTSPSVSMGPSAIQYVCQYTTPYSYLEFCRAPHGSESMERFDDDDPRFPGHESEDESKGEKTNEEKLLHVCLTSMFTSRCLCCLLY